MAEDKVASEDINNVILSHVLHGDIDEFQAEYLLKTRKGFRAQALATILQENEVSIIPTDN